MPLSAGTRLGPYEILAPLGAGGMGEVYRARDARLGREVALKILPAEVSGDPARRQRFEQEARAVAALNHPNIVAIHDIGEDRGVSYIVTELVDGESLRDAKFGLRKILDVASQIAGGLAAAHAAGIVHRDLKPENILLTRDGRVKILDFGLAKVVKAQKRSSDATETVLMNTEPGVVMGTVGYMSPEQARGMELDHRSDIFSLGTVLYELASGRHPFTGQSAADVMSAILKDDPPEMTGEVPPALERILRRCLEKEPSRRFQSAADLAFALESVGGTSSSAQVPAAAAEAPKVTRRTLLWAAGAAAAGASGFAAARLLSPGAIQPPRYRVVPTAGERVTSAVLHPDGKSIVYVARLNGQRTVFLQELEGGAPRALPLPDGSQPASLSARGDLAFLVANTLYRTPLASIAPRAVLEDVLAANWSGDGETLQVERHSGAKYQLEMPPGTLLFEHDRLMVGVCHAWKSGRTAFTSFTHDGPELMAVDKSGRKETLFSGEGHVIMDSGAAWSPDEREVWTAPLDGSDPMALVAYGGGQRQRLITRLPGDLRLWGISLGGAVLMSLEWNDHRARAMSPGGRGEVDIALDSEPRVLSADGSVLVLGGEPGSDSDTYLQRFDGSAPVLLGKGAPTAISPDGKWVQVNRKLTGNILIPTGPGPERKVEVPDIQLPVIRGWRGDRWVVWGHEHSRGAGVHVFFIFDPATGKKEMLKLELAGEQSEIRVSPDGARIVFADYLGKWSWARLDASDPAPIAGIGTSESVYGWTADGGGLYVGKPAGPKLAVERYDLDTGRRAPWKEFDSGRPDVNIDSFCVTPDGRAWAYSLNRRYARLILAEGLK